MEADLKRENKRLRNVIAEILICAWEDEYGDHYRVQGHAIRAAQEAISEARTDGQYVEEKK